MHKTNLTHDSTLPRRLANQIAQARHVVHVSICSDWEAQGGELAGMACCILVMASKLKTALSINM